MGSHLPPIEDIKTQPPGGEVKPIFTIGVPNANPEVREDIARKLNDRMPDYHILVYDNITGFDYEFNAFYPKDLDVKSFEELKEYVLTELKK